MSVAPPTAYARGMGDTRTLRVAVAVVAAVVIAAACTPTDDDPSDGLGREATIYESILDWMLEGESLPDDGERPAWTMYVSSRYERPIGVDVQVRVVESLDDVIEVRFIDQRSEAVDEAADEQPVREGGILIGLGAVPAEGDSVDVYVDRYRELDDVEAWEVGLRREGESWDVADATAVDVRPLPPSD